jgi:Na+/H+ antiporter NhaC
MQRSDGLLQLSPFFLFVSLFVASTIWFDGQFSAVTACLIAIIYAFMLFKKPLNEKIGIFLTGTAQPTILAMAFIFILSGAFTYILQQIGATDCAINMGLCLIPASLVLPGFFILVSFFATAIGSSMGTIAAFVPIALGMSSKLGLAPELLAGITVSGAMLGDNLSVISDTTIAATQTTGSSMTDKLKANILLVIPAFIMTLGWLAYINHGMALAQQPEICYQLCDLVKILPYLLVFVLTACGLDVIGVLVLAIVAAAAIGVWFGNFTLLQASQLITLGFTASPGLQEVLILVLFIAGLSYIVEYTGGMQYVVDHVGRRVNTKAGAEWAITLLTFIVNAAVAINTIAILVAGPIAKKVGDRFNIAPKRVACLLDITACICQGILPYAPQLLLAGSLAQVSSTSIMPYLHYQYAIALVLVCSIMHTALKNKVR